MATSHFSVSKLFSVGDIHGFTHFELCSKANQWGGKLPELLEGEALAVWMELSDVESVDYKVAKEEITEKLTQRLPLTTIKQLRASSDKIQLTAVVQCAQLLMTIEE